MKALLDNDQAMAAGFIVVSLVWVRAVAALWARHLNRKGHK